MAGTPEARARKKIDRALVRAGWAVQNRNERNLGAARGVAVREFTMAPGHGWADYLLFVDGEAVGALEAKKAGHTLSGVEGQAGKYSEGVPADIEAPLRPLPFLYLSTGVETQFINLLDPHPRSRWISAVHRPETLVEWLQADPLDRWQASFRTAKEGKVAEPPVEAWGATPSTLRGRLRTLPDDEIPGLWSNQSRAIGKLERSLAANHPRALIQMATGSGKSLMAVVSAYRLIKFGDARRILFLVDRANLGKQAETEFESYRAYDNHRKLIELYNVQRLLERIRKEREAARSVASTRGRRRGGRPKTGRANV